MCHPEDTSEPFPPFMNDANVLVFCCLVESGVGDPVGDGVGGGVGDGGGGESLAVAPRCRKYSSLTVILHTAIYNRQYNFVPRKDKSTQHNDMK